MYKLLVVILSFIVCVNISNAQLSTNSNLSENFLVQNVLLGTGVNASNITYTGSVDAIGNFNGSNCNIGLGSGVIMTTGTVKNSSGILGSQQGPFGPNDEGGAGIDNGEPGDMLLDGISSANTENAAILEFDFDAVGSSISFNYVFASEEYLEYVNAGYNDVFGFFLSGPNPAGGNYNNKNIAIIPGTNQSVTIDNLNDQNYSQYYINNGDGSSSPQNSDESVVQYDGFTTVLTAGADVVCGGQYHIKIAIADAGDGAYDSGVFLEAQSFSSTPSLSIGSQVVSGGSLPPNQMLEGCGSANVTFTRFDSINFSQTFQLSYAGSGTNGIDYSSMPSSITFNPGESTNTLTVNSIYDAVNEGTETVEVSITFSGDCGEAQTETITVQIVDQTPLELNMVDEVTIDCPNTPEYLVASPTGGAPEYTYVWNTGETTSYIYASPNVTSYYSVSVMDECGEQVAEDSIKVIVPIYAPLQIVMPDDTSLLCPNTPLDLFTDVTGGGGGYSWEWNTGEFIDDITVQTFESKIYTLTVSDMCGNDTTDSVRVAIVIPVLETDTYGSTTICPGDSADIGVVATSGAGYYEYAWSTGGNDADITVFPSQSSVFYVRVSDSCATYDIVDSVRVNVSRPYAEFSYMPEDIIVDDDVIFNNESTNAVSYYWDLGYGLTTTEFSPTTQYAVDEEVEVLLVATNSLGCSDSIWKTIIVHPELIFFVPNAFSPNDDGINDYFSGDGVGIKDYQLKIFDRWGHLVFLSESQRNAWDGRINGNMAPIGVYVWQYTLIGYDTSEFKRTGHVSLIR